MQNYLKLVISFVLCAGCSHFFYYPSKKTYFPPEKIGLVYEDIEFNSLDGTKLTGWFFPSSSKKVKGTVLQFHGNAQNISTHYLSQIWLIQKGYNLMTFDYRGFRNSEGSPSHKGIYNDARAAIKYCKEHYIKDKKHKFVVWGQSIGGTIALKALLDKDTGRLVDFLIIESSFPSYKKIAKEKMASHWFTWIFQPIAHIFISDFYSPGGKLKDLPAIPVLIIHGKADNIVSFYNGELIYNEISSSKEFLKIDEGSHIDSMYIENGKYRTQVLDFLESE